MDLVSILLAHQYPLTRRGLRCVITDSHQDWKVTGEAGNGQDTVTRALLLRPAVVIITLTLPGLNALDTVRRILEAVPGTRMGALGSKFSRQAVHEAREAGVLGFVLGADVQPDLTNCIQAVLENRVFLSSSMRNGWLYGSESFPIGSANPALTKREEQIIQLLADGKSNKQVADILQISRRTVESRRSQIMQKLELRSFPDLVRYAIRARIVHEDLPPNFQ